MSVADMYTLISTYSYLSTGKALDALSFVRILSLVLQTRRYGFLFSRNFFVSIWLARYRSFESMRTHSQFLGSNNLLIHRSQCEALVAIFPDKVVDSGSGYRAIKASYWANQAGAVSPSCFLQPANGGDVSTAVKILTQPQFRDLPACRFAVRSGGHTGWAGAGSIEGGVTIDLSNMKEVVVSPDKKMVTLGPGSRWGEVYPKLEDQGVAVSGGRWGKIMGSYSLSGY